MKEKTTNIDILELLAKKIEEQTSIIASCSSIINKKAEARERTEYIKIKEFVETLIAENKELIAENKELKVENKGLKEFKENIEKIDRKQLDKLYEDAQKALKEYRETQNKVTKLEEENKELKERNKRQQENLKIANKKIAAQRGQLMMLNKAYIPKSKVKEEIKELKQNVEEFEQYWSKDPRNFKKSDCVDYYKLEALQSLLGKE